MFFHSEKVKSVSANGAGNLQELSDEQLTQVAGGCDKYKKPGKGHHNPTIHHPSPSNPSSPSHPGSPSHHSH